MSAARTLEETAAQLEAAEQQLKKALGDAEVWRTAYFQATGRGDVDEVKMATCPAGCAVGVNLRLSGSVRGQFSCVKCGLRWRS